MQISAEISTSVGTTSNISGTVKVLFVDVPAIPNSDLVEARNTSRNISYAYGFPLGILYLSSYLKKHNNVQLAMVNYPSKVDSLLDYDNDDVFLEVIARESTPFIPDIIAFSAIFSSCHTLLMRGIKILKRLWPEAVTIVGGMHASNLVEKMLEHDEIDYVFRGEAEIAISQFVRDFTTPERDAIKGIYSRKSIMITPPSDLCEFVENLDTLPFPDWDLIDMEDYVTRGARTMVRTAESELEKRSAIIMTSRGCPFSCSFCSSHSVHGRLLRYRSIQNVLEEVQVLHEKYGVTRFIPEDDLFAADKVRVVVLLDALRKLQIPGFEIQFPNALSPTVLSEEVQNALIGAGMKLATVAIDSGSQFTQNNLIRRGLDLNRARTVVASLMCKGIIVRCNFIIGFPHETKELMQETVDFARSLEVDWCTFGLATPLVGSEMYDEFLKLGCIKDDESFWGNCDYRIRTFDTEEITKEELMDFVYRANLDINFINNPNLRHGNYQQSITVFSDIVVKHPFHIFGWYCLMLAHRGLGHEKETKTLMQKIKDLIETDPKAAEMYDKYNDMLPDLLTSIITPATDRL